MTYQWYYTADDLVTSRLRHHYVVMW